MEVERVALLGNLRMMPQACSAIRPAAPPQYRLGIICIEPICKTNSSSLLHFFASYVPVRAWSREWDRAGFWGKALMFKSWFIRFVGCSLLDETWFSPSIIRFCFFVCGGGNVRTCFWKPYTMTDNMCCNTFLYTVSRIWGGAQSELSSLQEKSSMFACKLSVSSTTPSDNRPEQRNKAYKNHTKPPAQTLSSALSDTCIKTNQTTTVGLPAPVRRWSVSAATACARLPKLFQFLLGLHRLPCPSPFRTYILLVKSQLRCSCSFFFSSCSTCGGFWFAHTRSHWLAAGSNCCGRSQRILFAPVTPTHFA